MHTKFWLKNLKGRDHSENLCINGKLILRWILEKQWEVLDWIHLTEDRDQLQSVAKIVMSLGFHKNAIS
jgi:hypothetical protein